MRHPSYRSLAALAGRIGSLRGMNRGMSWSPVVGSASSLYSRWFGGQSMGAGESAGDRAKDAAAAAEHLQKKADRAAEASRRWEQGREGEERLADLLRSLSESGFRLLADRGFPGQAGNLDLLVVGPTGVFVLDAKNWSGRLEIDGTALRHNGRRRVHEIEAVRGQAAMVAEVLDRGGMDRVPVRPALCFMGAATVGGRRGVERVHLVDAGEACAFVAGQDVVLNDEWIEAVYRYLSDALPSRSGRESGVEEAPEEPVVFMTLWARFGKRRLYVKDELGMDGGYLDLIEGTAVGTSPAAASVLQQLVPHYLNSGNSMELSDADRGAIRRFLSSLLGTSKDEPHVPLVVGRVWRKHGMQRLYVHRLGSNGTKVDLGWFDLTNGRVQADQHGSEPVIRYCGNRYLAVQKPTQ